MVEWTTSMAIASTTTSSKRSFPKLNLSFLNDSPIVSILAAMVIFLLGAAMGGMYTKIQYLEGKTPGVTPTVVQNPTAPAAPSEPEAPTVVTPTVTANDPFLGNANAEVTIVEWADYQCPFCERYFTDIFGQIKKDYIDTGKVKFVFKNLAFLGKESTDAANAAMCAKEQNKFWEYHDYLFTNQQGENQGAFSVDNLKKFAVTLGLNAAQFNSCLDSQKYNTQVQEDIADANKNGFNSTPSTAVGSTPIVGAQPYATFKAAIEAELAK